MKRKTDISDILIDLTKVAAILVIGYIAIRMLLSVA